MKTVVLHALHGHFSFWYISRTFSSFFYPREILGSFSFDDVTAMTTPQIKNLIGRVRKHKRAARAARTYEQVRAILGKTTTRNYHINGIVDNLSIQP